MRNRLNEPREDFIGTRVGVNLLFFRTEKICTCQGISSMLNLPARRFKAQPQSLDRLEA